MTERRRSPRTSVGPADLAILPTAQDVQVLDISVVGVLLQLGHPIEQGARGCLRINIWGAPFTADVEIRRVSRISDPGREPGYRVGASFVNITPEHRQLIERFASQ